MKEKEKVLKELDNEILNILNPEDMETDMEATIEFELEMSIFISKVRKYLESFNEEDASTIISTSSSKGPQGVKLPTLNIKVFDRNPLDWQTFLDTFESSVNSRADLSKVQKFQYLIGYLKMLKERYGNPQLIISAHMNKIMKIEKISRTSDANELRNLLDSVESHVRALGNQG